MGIEETIKRTKAVIRKRPEPNAFRKIGLGREAAIGNMPRTGLGDSTNQATLSSIIEDIRNRVHCPVMNIPNIEEVDWVLDGPQTDGNITESFGAQIDPLHSGKSPAINGSVETTLAMPGVTQTYMIICAIGWHLEPEPFCYSIPGNAWTKQVSAVAKPISPDFFTANDLVRNGGNSALGTAATDTFLPAFLDWGQWANYVAWLMVRGYNLRWQIGQNLNLIDDQLRNTAYMPSSAQSGSASSSLIDVADTVRRTNDYYDSLGSTLDFLKVDALRIGSVGNAPNVGAFHPSRDEEFADATYGGIGLREMLKGNSEFRTLTTPYMLEAGVPIGLIAEESDTALANTMRNYLSITQGLGGVIPPQLVDANGVAFGNTAAGGAGVTAVERTLDGLNVSQQFFSQRVMFKGGRLKISVKIKGFEVTQDVYDLMRHNSQARDAICNECGIQLAKLGA